MLDLLRLKIFLLVADLKSLALAAKHLNLSSAAISKQLTKLEKEVGVQLLTRTTRQVELTEIGKSYYLQCQSIFAEVEAADAFISQAKQAPCGLLKVVSSRHFADRYLFPYLQEFLLAYPDLKLDLELAERIPDLNREGIDILIGMSLSATGEVIQKKIATTCYTFCASPSYLRLFGRPVCPKELKNHRYITHSMRSVEKIELLWQIRANDVQAMVTLAKNGIGIVKLHRYAVEEEIKQGNLVEILKPYAKKNIPLYVAYPKKRFVASKIRFFIDYILAKMNS